MKTFFDPTQVWQRIDELNSKSNLLQLTKELDINYGTIRSQRTRNDLPNVEMLWKFSQKFNVSIEYLLNGKSDQKNSYPPNIKKIADKLTKVSKLNLLSIENIVDNLPEESIEDTKNKYHRFKGMEV